MATAYDRVTMDEVFGPRDAAPARSPGSIAPVALASLVPPDPSAGKWALPPKAWLYGGGAASALLVGALALAIGSAKPTNAASASAAAGAPVAMAAAAAAVPLPQRVTTPAPVAPVAAPVVAPPVDVVAAAPPPAKKPIPGKAHRPARRTGK